MATTGSGTISISPDDPTILIGRATKFTEEFAPRRQIMLSKAYNNVAVEVMEIISDTEIRIKKEFPKKVADGIALKPDGIPYKVSPCSCDQIRSGTDGFQGDRYYRMLIKRKCILQSIRN